MERFEDELGITLLGVTKGTWLHCTYPTYLEMHAIYYDYIMLLKSRMDIRYMKVNKELYALG